MAYIKSNPNPCGSYVGDCVVRALSIAFGKNWYETYMELCIKGFEMCDMPSSNRVWDQVLKDHGFHRYIIPNNCPECYTIRDFCGEYFNGIYVVGTGTHVVAVINGNLMDSWNSSDETPIYFWSKEE